MNKFWVQHPGKSAWEHVSLSHQRANFGESVTAAIQVGSPLARYGMDGMILEYRVTPHHFRNTNCSLAESLGVGMHRITEKAAHGLRRPCMTSPFVPCPQHGCQAGIHVPRTCFQLGPRPMLCSSIIQGWHDSNDGHRSETAPDNG